MISYDDLQLLTFVVTAAVATFGVFQYVEAQRWKVSEFVSSEMRIMFDNVNVKAVAKMLDWEDGTVVIEHPKHDGDCKSFEFERGLVLQSLRAYFEDGPNPAMLDFSDDEETIRDLFDGFLAALDRCDVYISQHSRLFSPERLRPYLLYYLDIINEEDEYGNAIRNFAEVYDYWGVADLVDKVASKKWRTINPEAKRKTMPTSYDLPF